jgi:hypothetical protein
MQQHRFDLANSFSPFQGLAKYAVSAYNSQVLGKIKQGKAAIPCSTQSQPKKPQNSDTLLGSFGSTAKSCGEQTLSERTENERTMRHMWCVV